MACVPASREEREDQGHRDPKRHHDDRARIGLNGHERRDCGPEITRTHSDGQETPLPLFQAESEPVTSTLTRVGKFPLACLSCQRSV